jgi:phage terminase small subunit
MTPRQPGLTVLQGSSQKLRPPPELTEAERKIFVDIVASVDAKHFVPSDLPLLASYAVAINQERTAHAHLSSEGHVFAGRPSPWITVQEKSHRMMTALSMRLRLAPQSRTRTKVRPDKLSVYERMRIEEGDEDDDD